MMADLDYHAEERGPTRVYTPSLDSEEELVPNSSLTLSERNYRLFSFKKEGRSWANALCSESTLSETEIRKRAKRTKKPTHSVDQQLEKMSLPRRMAIEDLLDRTHRRDPDGDRWDIVTIDNDKPEWTKRTGEVLAFSVILARLNPTRQRTGSISQDRRRSSFRSSPQREYAVPNRRGSKSYHARQSPTRENGSGRLSQSFKNSQTILEDDPFGNANLFSNDGKPINPEGSAPFTNCGLPPHIPLDEPIGAKPQKDKHDKFKNKKDKANKDDDIVDLDALLGNVTLDDDVLVTPLDNDHHGHDEHHGGAFDFDSPIQVIGDDRPRGRKRADSGWGEKTPKRGMSGNRSKSKSKPRGPPIQIPKDDYGRPIPDITPGGRRNRQAYWGSHGSATTPSIHSDQSVLEAEYEEYSSSGSSAGYEDVWRNAYMPSDGRYPRATRDHRRGPPSPQHPRYSEIPEPYIFSSRPRRERYASDTAITPYKYTTTAQTANRPPLITQHTAPRFAPTPTSAHPATADYNYSSGLVPFPHETQQPTYHRRRESLQAVEAQLYMQRDREIELLQRERDVARREAELHQEEVRKATVRTGGSSKYTHEPRLSRRYTDVYEGGRYRSGFTY